MGPLSNKEELTAYRDMLITVAERMIDAIKEGRTLEEVLAAEPTAEYDEALGREVPLHRAVRDDSPFGSVAVAGGTGQAGSVAVGAVPEAGSVAVAAAAARRRAGQLIATTSVTSGIRSLSRFSTPIFRVATEDGQPMQLPIR